MGSVREATFEVAREHGMTTWFGNPGSPEIPRQADQPLVVDVQLEVTQ